MDAEPLDPSATSKWLRAGYLAYGLALVAPAYVIDYYSKPTYEFGAIALLLGPVGLFTGHYSWLANVLLWDAWIAIKKGRPLIGALMSLAALPLAGTFLFGKEITAGDAGTFSYNAHADYYLWLVSMALTLVASSVKFAQDRHRSST